MAGLGRLAVSVLGLALVVTAPSSARPAETASVDIGSPQLVNRNSAGEVSSYSAAFGDLDRSGRYVAFYSSAPNLHPPGVDYTGVYLRDRRTGKTSMPVRNRHGKPNKMGSDNGRLSPNGRFLAYCSFDPNIVKPDSFVFDSADLPYLRDYDVFVRDLRTGKTRRLSTAWNGKEADDYSCGATVADNGDTTFESSASNLVRGDPDPEVGDVYLYDWSSGHLYRLGQLDHDVLISGDGGTVIGLAGRRLDPADHNTFDDVYLLHRRRDGSPGRVDLLSRKPGGGGLDLGCEVPLTISYDARYVVGSCRDGEVFEPPIPDKVSHLVLFDRKRGTRTLLNPSPDTYSAVDSVAVSDDGRSVFFGSTNYGFAGTAAEVGPDVYYWRRGQGLTLVSPGDDSTYRWAYGWVAITGDGSQVLFDSDSALVEGDNTRGVLDPDVYVVRIGE